MRVYFLLAYAVLIVMKMPQILLKGRFWAEEGAVYFINARTQSGLDALFAVHTGYLNLPASIATLLAARVVPLDHAPWVSTGFAMLIQLCPPVLLVTSGILWLQRPWAIGVALLMTLIIPTSGELWLNSITSQFHLALCAALILAMPKTQGVLSVFRGGVLLFAGFSGPGSAFLTPLFFARAYFDPSRYRIVQSFLLGLASMIQLFIVLIYPEPGRTYGTGIQLLALIIYEKNILIPFLGFDLTNVFAQDLANDFKAGHALWGPTIIGLTAIAMMIGGAWRSRNMEVKWLLACGLVIMVIAYCGALGQHVHLLDVGFGGRYSDIPSVLFGLTLFGIVQNARGFLRWSTAMLVCWLLWTGLDGYFEYRLPFADGPSWQTNLAKWRSDPGYRIQFWPDDPLWLWYMLPSSSCVSDPRICPDGHG
jgi:hypothetical protein